ncbi:MAG TPA: prolyl oligopeptidase family serine peptidase [Pseudogracilibacillus sp.]|nr:prolyl oligopeptidase family serine peptidase [Pseudogracilibacillus sp.]
MITINNENIAEVESLVIEAKEHKNKPLPTVIFYHGFQSAKENNLTLAYLLAKENYRVILPEARYHGERSENLTDSEMSLAFWDIILANIAELEKIKADLEKDNLILNYRIGVAGTSMGGITTTAMLKEYSWIKTGVVLMGSPDLTKFSSQLIENFNKTSEEKISEEEEAEVINQLLPFDLSKNIKALNNRPLMFWHGELDDIVPINQSESFVELLKKSSYSGEVKMLKEKNRGHHLSRYSILETVRWFVKHL